MIFFTKSLAERKITKVSMNWCRFNRQNNREISEEVTKKINLSLCEKKEEKEGWRWFFLQSSSIATHPEGTKRSIKTLLLMDKIHPERGELVRSYVFTTLLESATSKGCVSPWILPKGRSISSFSVFVWERYFRKKHNRGLNPNSVAIPNAPGVETIALDSLISFCILVSWNSDP